MLETRCLAQCIPAHSWTLESYPPRYKKILQYLENYPSPISKKYSHLFGKYSDFDLRFGRFVAHNSETTQKSYVI